MSTIEVLKALADETRMRMLSLLYQETLCVCDLEAILKLSQSNASRHLTKLKNARLITSEKQAQWVYHRADEKMLATCSFVKELLAAESDMSPLFRKDLARLRKYRECGGGCGRTVKIDEE
ncbi:MAG TPA: metalloregulator ArsR/SmtB family transcription factor [Methylomusa anaerophila]|uniref:HTH-type transcriptional repressor AseR n=1 Tax=Methylomusa anaerophila TaxID=1930071 RepID=A0A348AG64_9FIRM|nr:metalloregulator ArsR/SmtB family transcription factor [Methylomusa anaerophila]BBB90062.1 HTH-type transcriptional repressor AseR [Methylomusa anaerophila]HML88211.1 metalloregulator ArsR/SmtB family transcription factor [Methylomusa anaerophila]